MKVKVFLILAGVAALHLLLIAGFAVSGGCKGPEVLGERKYIPAKVPADKTADATAVTTPEKVSVATSEKMAPVKKSTPPPVVPDLVPDKAPTNINPAPIHKATGDSYKVQSGDTLSKIAKTHGVSVSALAAANNISTSKMLKVGQPLVIPGAGTVVATHEPAKKAAKPAAKKEAKATKKDVDAKDAKKEKTDKDSAKTDEKAVEKTDAAATDAKDSYTVKKGDSIPLIAKKLHVKASDLRKANNLKETSKLAVGQKLTVPAAKKSAEGDVAEKGDDAAKAKTENVDDMVNQVPAATPAADSATTKPAGPAAPAKAGAVGADAAKTAPVAAVPSTSKEAVEVDKATTVEAFAQKYGVKVDDIKKLNPDLPKDGKLTVGKIIIIPSPAN